MTNCVRLFGHWFHLVLQLTLKGTAFPCKASHSNKLSADFLAGLYTQILLQKYSAHIKAQSHDINIISEITGSSLVSLISFGRECGPKWTREERRSRGIRIKQLKKINIPESHKKQNYEQLWNQVVRLWSLLLLKSYERFSKMAVIFDLEIWLSFTTPTNPLYHTFTCS